MSYTSTILFRVQWITQLGVIALFLAFDWSVEVQALFAGALLCTVGIPHGAADYLYRDTTKLGLLAFTLRYVGVMLLYLTVWWLAPLVALALFFAISFHHFGQSNFNNASLWYWPSLLWGVWILVFPVLLHWHEAISIFRGMLLAEGGPAVILPDVVRFGIATVLGGAYLVCVFVFQRDNWRPYFLQFAVVTIWYLATPLLFGFVVVFCLWHALQSLQHQMSHFTLASSARPSRFILALLPFGIAALLGFALFVYFRGFNIGESFILLSLITLPHVVVMHRLHGIAR